MARRPMTTRIGNCACTTYQYRFLCSRPPRRGPGCLCLGLLLSSQTSPNTVFSPDVAIQLFGADRRLWKRAKARCQLSDVGFFSAGAFPAFFFFRYAFNVVVLTGFMPRRGGSPARWITTDQLPNRSRIYTPPRTSFSKGVRPFSAAHWRTYSSNCSSVSSRCSSPQAMSRTARTCCSAMAVSFLTWCSARRASFWASRSFLKSQAWCLNSSLKIRRFVSDG